MLVAESAEQLPSAVVQGSSKDYANADAPPSAKLLVYLNVMNDLQSSEESKSKLLLQVKELQAELQSQKDDKKDIYYYLNKKCDDSYNIISQLEEQLSMEQLDRENCEKAYEQKILELEHRMLLDEEKSKQAIGALEDQLARFGRFEEIQRAFEAQISETNETLDRERSENAKQISELELLQTVTTSKLRKEKETALAELRVEMHNSLESRMPAEVQKTLLINTLIRQELKQQSLTAMDVLDRDLKLQQRAKEMKLELSLAQDQDRELTTALSAHQKMIKGLNEQLARETELKEQTKREVVARMHQKDAEIAILRQQLKSLETRLTDAVNTQRLHEVWYFLSDAYDAHSAPRHHPSVCSHDVKRHPLTPSADSLHKEIQLYPLQPEWTNEQEKLLVTLIRDLLLRYPSKFKHVVGGQQRIILNDGLPVLAPPSGYSDEKNKSGRTGSGCSGTLTNSPFHKPRSRPKMSPGNSTGVHSLLSSESMQTFRNIFLPSKSMDEALLEKTSGSGSRGASPLSPSVVSPSRSDQGIEGTALMPTLQIDSSLPSSPPNDQIGEREKSPPPEGESRRAFKTAFTTTSSSVNSLTNTSNTCDTHSVGSVASQTSYSSRASGLSYRSLAEQVAAKPGGSFGIRGPKIVAKLNMRELISDKVLKAVNKNGFNGSVSGLGVVSRKLERARMDPMLQLRLSSIRGIPVLGHDDQDILSPASSVSMSPRHTEDEIDDTASYAGGAFGLMDDMLQSRAGSGGEGLDMGLEIRVSGSTEMGDD